jgi:hypothetical protein
MDKAFFVYTGLGEVPQDVVRIRFDPAFLVVPEGIFESRINLEELSYLTVYVKLKILHLGQDPEGVVHSSIAEP